MKKADIIFSVVQPAILSRVLFKLSKTNSLVAAIQKQKCFWILEYVGQSFCIVGSFNLFFVMTGFLGSVFFTLLQLYTKSICVLALKNSPFEASSSSPLQIVNFVALVHKAIFLFVKWALEKNCGLIPMSFWIELLGALLCTYVRSSFMEIFIPNPIQNTWRRP